MSDFLCTVCKNKLARDDEGRRFVCPLGHSFDIASQGYVNLLAGARGQVHGDDKQMCRARRDFLNCGYYEPLLDKLCEIAVKYAPNGSVILDSGCGEGYYTSGINNALTENGIAHKMLGIDVSKDAILLCAKRNKALSLAVASVYDMPISDGEIDIVFTLFAPFAGSEYIRVLKNNGKLVMAIPDRRHLFSLKEKIYDEPYENEVQSFDVDGFTLLEKHSVKSEFHLDDNEKIKALFGMTPYRYKTDSKGLCRLDELSELRTSAEFIVLVYEKTVS